MTNLTSEPKFSVINLNNSVIVKLPQRLTLLESVSFKQLCTKLIDHDSTPKQIILDLHDTQFIDSSGIGALVKIYHLADSRGCELILQQVQPLAMKVLEISGLTEVFQLQVAEKSLPKKNVATHPSINCLWKRGIDFLGAIVGLVITAIACVPIAIAIKLDSPGPILFKQTRCGWLGRKFPIWKFRSMCVDAEKIKNKIPNQANGAFFKNDFDPRITKVGRFLRRTSLDELPQFWNVLRGEMSLVGTRPPTPDEVAKYQVPEWQRLNVKPGMTGEWQVNGRSQIRNFEDVIKMDLKYQKNWSLLYDFKLILKTIIVVFHKDSGAI